jgi:hypothetical protein
MATEGLHIFLDTNSLSHCNSFEREIVKRILTFNNRPFTMQRTPFPFDDFKDLEEIETTTDQKVLRVALSLEILEDEVFQTPLSEGQKELLFIILIHSAIRRPYIESFIKDSIFVTQDQIFLKNVYSVNRQKKCLRDFFPYLRIVNLEGALEIMDSYAKMIGIYFGIWSKRDRLVWYQLRLYSNLKYAPVIYGNQYIGISKKPSAEIEALIFRFIKLLLCKDYLGRQHYFGLSREESIDSQSMADGLKELKGGNPYPEGLGSLINLDDMLLLFYHVEYVISLVTGIFDNLAVETSTTHNLHFDPIRISLSNTRGDDFLKEVANVDSNLKKHIDLNRDFINLIYSLRERVVHGEGLSRSIAPIVPNWSNFITIDNQIKSVIRQCGDKDTHYGIITEWGVIQTNGKIYLDPFYFAKSVVEKLMHFTNEYLRLLGFDQYSINAEREEVFKNGMKHFRNNGLFSP